MAINESIAADLVHDFRHEADKTRRVLAAVPEAQFDWKPHEKSMSLGQLAGHIAENPAWVAVMQEAEMDLSATEEYVPFVPKSLDELLATHDANAAVFEKIVSGMTDEFMHMIWTMRSGDKVMMQQARHDAVRTVGLHHWLHHRGQLTVYLRLLDVPVPTTYGPTADEQV